jgi:hypothetical protein
MAALAARAHNEVSSDAMGQPPWAVPTPPRRISDPSPSASMKPAILTLLAASAALAGHGLVLADSGRSLNQVRSELNNGTWAGTRIFESQPKAEPPAGSASAAGAARAQAAASDRGASAATAVAPAARARSGGLFGWGEPPTGQPLSSAKHLDSATVGIEFPTAAAGARNGADPSSKGR